MSTKNLEEAADYLKIASETMRNLADHGVIPGAKVGKQWVFRTADLDTYLIEEVRRQTEERRESSRLGIRAHVPTAASKPREANARRRAIPDLPSLPA